MSKKILIVEDENDIRAVLVAWLEDEKYDVVESSDGIDGLAEFERFHPDLALLDMNMPGMSGVELCRSIRQTSRIPIVMFTAVADAEEVHAAIEVGVTDFVLKETGFDELVDRISEHLAVERHSISKADLDEALPALAVRATEVQQGGVGRSTETGPEGGTHSSEKPGSNDLWNWDGEYFGFREAGDLWNRDGRHVGRFRRDEVFKPNGAYMGELVNGRLVVDWHKTARQGSSFTPSDNRGGHARFADREPFDMMIGYRDFPGPEQA